MDLKNKVRETVLRYNMLEYGDKVLVALSGGADSVCLLTVLCELKNMLGIDEIAAAHLNHGLRESAQRDTDFCEKLCKEKNIRFFKKHVDIKAFAKSIKTCEEDAGRIARYRFFEELKEKYGYNKIATAHNMNDRAETFLMRVLSGSSLEGLSGIKPMREDNVIRPLLDTKRNEIEEYLSNLSQCYMTDETNFSDVYKRNSLRLNLIPYIEKNYNPNVIETFAAMAENLRRDAEYIGKKTKEISDNVSFPIKLEELPKEPTALIRVMADKLDTSFSRNAGDLLVSFINKGNTGSSLPVDKERFLYIEYGKLYIKTKTPKKSYSYKLAYGKNYIEEIDACFILSEGEGKGKDCINVSDISNLTVRTRKDGDRIYIKSLSGSKKLKDIFIDKKISRELRDIWPVVCENEKIIWLTGIYKNENKNAKYNIKAEWRNGDV